MRIAVVLCCLLLVTACAQDTSSRPSPTEPRSAVSVSGDELALEGRPWWPTGLNAYQLGTRWSVNVGCGAEVDLDEFFASLPPHSLTRFDAFQSHAVHRVGEALDFSALDPVFETAAKYGQLVVPVLVPQDSGCDAGGYKEAGWYADGWRQPLPGHVLSFEDWARVAIDRWRDSPSVAMWELIGEPEAAVCGDDACTLERRDCYPDGAQLLRDWIDDVGSIVRSSDPQRPITLGTIGGDQCGTAGDDFDLVTGSKYVDVVQYHDYDGGRFLAQRLAETDKPLLVAELGIRAGSCLGVEERAADIDATLGRYRDLGADGALLWAFVPDPRADECTYDIGPGDPVRRVLATRGATG